MPYDREKTGNMDLVNEVVTGYSIYNQDVKKRTKHNPLNELYPVLPDEKYDVIYADPPWDYNGKLQYDKSSKAKEELDPSKPIFISSASFKYPTLKLEELKKLDIRKISADNCLLFMWTTSPHLVQAIELGTSWGFEYRTVAFVWDKMSHNPGQYTLSNCELCLVFKKGKIPTPRGARNVQQLVRVKRTKHSAKPKEVREGIERMFPSQKKIELFARTRAERWDVWGLEIQTHNNSLRLKKRGLETTAVVHPAFPCIDVMVCFVAVRFGNLICSHQTV